MIVDIIVCVFYILEDGGDVRHVLMVVIFLEMVVMFLKMVVIFLKMVVIFLKMVVMFLKMLVMLLKTCSSSPPQD